MNRVWILMAASVALHLGTEHQASAGFVSLNPSGNVGQTVSTTYDNPNPPTTITGYGSSYSSVAQYFYVRYPALTFSQTSQFIVKFDLASLAGANITAATLDFSIPSSSATRSFTAFGYGSSTSLTSSDDFTTGTSVGGASRSFSLGTPRTGDVFSLDVSFLRTLAAAGVPAVAFRFAVESSPSGYPNPEGVTISPPTLNVTFQPAAVPEPSSLSLVGLAGLGWIGARALRRRPALAA